MEYIIYCDESVSDGKYYTDFFGGVLVRNELIPEGATERGHRTIAKEKLFHHIFQLILECDCIEFFDISKTTPITVPKDFWTMPYRHWKFTTREYRTEGADIKKEKSPA